MKNNFFLALFCILYGGANAQDQNYTFKTPLSQRDSAIVKRDSVIMMQKRTEVEFAAKYGNKIAYLKDCDDHLKEWLFNRYGIYADYYSEFDKYAKLYMDSLIYLNYGKDIYEKARRESDSVYKGISPNVDLDGSYFVGCNPPYYLCGSDALYDDIDRLVGIKPDLKKENVYAEEIVVDFVIDSLGYLKTPRIIRKTKTELNDKILNALRNLPCKWMPSIDDNGKKLSTKMSIKLIGYYPPASPDN